MIKAYKASILNYKNEFLWIGIGLFVQLISGLVIIKLLTHSLRPDQFGTLNLFNSVTQFIEVVIFSSLIQGAGRFAFSTPSIQYPFQAIYAECRRLFCITFCILLIGSTFMLYKKEIEYSILALFAIATIYFDVRRDFILGIFHMDRKRKLATSFRSFDQLARVFFILLLIYLAHINILSVIGAYIIISGILFWILLKKKNRDYPIINSTELLKNKELKSKIIDFAIPFGFLSIFTWIQLWADRWILNGYLGLKSVGIYASYTQIANVPFSMLASLTLTFFIPVLFKQAEEVKKIEEYHAFRMKIKHILAGYTILSVLMLMLVFIIKVFILRILLPSSYIIDSMLFFYISIGGLLFQYGQVQTVLCLHTSGDSRLVLYANIIAGLTYLLLLVIFVKKYSVEGAPFAFILCNILRSTLLYLFSIKSWANFKDKILFKSLTNNNYE